MPANKTGVNDPLPILVILAKLIFSFSIWLADQLINCGVCISEGPPYITLDERLHKL